MADHSIHDYTLEKVPVDQIDVGVRRRQDFGDIDSFAAEIGQLGLYHPILLLDKSFIEGEIEGTLDSNRPYFLLAGERRLRAVKANKWPEIEAKIFRRPLDDWEIRLVELHENLHRKNMTPTEEALAVKELHETYQRVHGVASSGRGSKGHTVQDTAEMLGQSRSSVSSELEVANYIGIVEGLEQAKTKSDARKLVKAYKDKLIKEELARREEKRTQASAKAAGKASLSSPEKPKAKAIDDKRSILMQRYVTGDFYENIKKVTARTIDLIELDPDWGILFKERVAARGSLSTQDYQILAPEDYEEGLEAMARECFRVLKDNSWLLVWYSIEEWHKETVTILEKAGFTVQRMPAFWLHDRKNTATPAYRLGQSTESFLYCRKGNIRIGNMGHGNAFKFRGLEKNERFHPAEKPIELYEEIIQTFLGKERRAAGLITGFAGSGNFILAGDNLGHNAIGFDSSETYRDNYILRVNAGLPGEYKTYL